jgi:hypothetical protein
MAIFLTTDDDEFIITESGIFLILNELVVRQEFTVSARTSEFTVSARTTEFIITTGN